MKTLLRFLPLLLPTLAVAAPVAAHEAMVTVGRQKGDAYLASLVEMRGEEGTPQPRQWTLLFRDPTARGGLREFTVSGKGVVSERTPLHLEDALLVMPAVSRAKLKLDSPGAFNEADKLATKMRLGFDSVSYRLHSSGKAPVWTLRLFDAGGHEVGALSLSAENGAVVSPLIRGDRGAAPGASSAAPAEARPLGERWAEGGGLVGHMKRWSTRTWEATTNAASGVGRSVETFFVGRPASAPSKRD